MPHFVRVCQAQDVANGEVRPVDADGTRIALCRVGDHFYALSNFCPHLSGNLSEGRIEDDTLICPEHYWRFKLATGRCVTVRGQSAHAFPVRVEDGWVLVGV
jgi:NAD(P)H-dependent nitrite reductase small subunit